MTLKPYVGITGPTSLSEVSSLVEAFATAGYSMDSPHVPMLGYLVSHKTLRGQPTANRRYPPVKELSPLIEAAKGRILPMVHYNTKDHSTLASQVGEIFVLLYNALYPCRALQLNVVWPGVDQVKLIKDIYPEMLIVLQASHKAMGDKTPSEIAARINAYGKSISYVLIDPSGGRGQEFDLGHSLAVYQEIREKLPELMVGFAGGFTGDNVEARVREIISRTGEDNFCIDAEGGLRNKISAEYGDDLLNSIKAQAYLQGAAKVLK